MTRPRRMAHGVARPRAAGRALRALGVAATTASALRAGRLLAGALFVALLGACSSGTTEPSPASESAVVATQSGRVRGEQVDGVAQVVASGDHNLIVASNGTPMAFGGNAFRECGSTNPDPVIAWPGEVYNIGGGRQNSCSILEAFDRIAAISGKKMHYEYVDKNREGDHICYISDLTKMKAHYPGWGITKSLDDVFEEIHRASAQ